MKKNTKKKKTLVKIEKKKEYPARNLYVNQAMPWE